MFNPALPSWQRASLILGSAVIMLSACGEKPSQAPGDMKVPVSVVTVEPGSAEIFVELPGRVQAIKDAQIRARVTGIVKEINFKQGSDVKEGQLLFTIDPAQYEAQRAQVAAQLKNAEADVHSARLFAQRYAKLIKSNAVSRQEYDNAVAQAGQAEAAVSAAKAALQAADINLSYTKVVSPINGRIGKSLVTEGALVSATAATEMANVQQLDRVYVDVTQSTTELAQLRRALASGQFTEAEGGNAVAQVVLDDGTVYKHDGTLLFSGVTVDPSTGQVSLRAEFDNPDKVLLPGMYVRVRLQQGVDKQALQVPQQAVQRTADGLNTLMLVKDGKIAPMAVALGPLVQGRYIIYKGLNPGDTVVVEGFQKIRPGAAVQPMPWKNGEGQAGSQDAAAPASGDAPAGAPAPSGAPAAEPETPAPKSAAKG